MKFLQNIKPLIIGAGAMLISIGALQAQDIKVPLDLKAVKVLDAMPVKNQARTGTCWSFATTSFIESELIRMGKGRFDLSEMFFSRHAYEKKAELFVRYHAATNFGQGGQAHDVMHVIRKFGFIPDKYYHGIQYGEENHNHNELSTVLKYFLDGVLQARQLSPVWTKGYSAILDTYYGEVPESFEVDGKTTNTIEFAKSLEFNPDDYIEITSYTHQPYYEQYVLEVPDNWSNDLYYNLPLEEFMEVINHALNNGYTVAWDGDVSDRGFSSRNGLGIVPETDWADMDEEAQANAFKESIKEKNVTKEMRQKAYDTFKATDDHLMHLTGIYKDADGKIFYLTKNSHGTRYDWGGYVYMSEAYVRLNTLAFMVHKDALPKDIARKLGF